MMRLNCKKNSYDLVELLFLLCIIVGIIVLIALSKKESDMASTKSFNVSQYGEWTVDTKNESTFYHKLPSDLNTQAILFRTPFQSLEVFVGSQLIYYIDYGKTISFQRFGSAYHIVNLESNNANQMISIYLKGGHSQPNDIEFVAYIGQPQQLLYYILAQNLSELIIGISMLVLGFLFLLVSILFTKKIKTKMTLHIGIFVLLFSVGLLLSTDIPQLIYNNHIIFVYLQYNIFLLLPVSLILNLRELFLLQKNKGLKIFIGIYSMFFISRVIMQMIQVDTTQIWLDTLFIYSGLMYCFTLVVIKKSMPINKCIKKPVKILGILLLLSIILDSFYYFTICRDEIAKFSKYSLCLYVFYMLYRYVQEYVEKTRDYTEAKMMAKLAYKDVMTGLYNRTAYAKDILEFEKLICYAPNDLKLIYVIFDLNNLKEMNDSHGHGVGDYYIVTTGQIIKKAFEKIGKCYRIGGDEFAVIIQDKTIEDYCDAILLLRKLMKTVNETNEFEFSLAFGVAVYEAGKYATLKELIDKADKNMYDNKNIYKGTKLCEDM